MTESRKGEKLNATELKLLIMGIINGGSNKVLPAIRVTTTARKEGEIVLLTYPDWFAGYKYQLQPCTFYANIQTINWRQALTSIGNLVARDFEGLVINGDKDLTYEEDNKHLGLCDGIIRLSKHEYVSVKHLRDKIKAGYCQDLKAFANKDVLSNNPELADDRFTVANQVPENHVLLFHPKCISLIFWRDAYVEETGRNLAITCWVDLVHEHVSGVSEILDLEIR